MKTRKALITEHKKLKQEIEDAKKTLERLQSRESKVEEALFAPFVAQMDDYLKKVLTHLKEIDGKGRFPLHTDEELEDPLIVSKGEYDYVNDRVGDSEVIKSADHLFLDEKSRRVMVCFVSRYLDADWNDERENVPFTECADWLCGTYDGEQDTMLMEQIHDTIDDLCCGGSGCFYPNGAKALDLAGPREFSTGALSFDDRYDEIGNLVFRKGIVRIKAGQYAGCDKVEEIHIPEGVTEIEEGAFRGCSRLWRVDLPGSVVKVCDHAFEDCWRLSTINFPKGLRAIESMAFRDCHNLKCIKRDDLWCIDQSERPCFVSFGKICEGAAELWHDDHVAICDLADNSEYSSLYKTLNDEGLFQGGDDVLIVALPDNEDRGMVEIHIPEGVAEISESTFEYREDLRSIHLPDSVTSIGESAFSGCTGLTEIHIPDSVTSIREWAFSGCTGLTVIHIPNNVSSIGRGALAGNCFVEMAVSPENRRYDSREGCNAVIESDTNTLIAGCKSTIIPASVTSIGERAFFGCEGLTEIYIPNSVTKIGERAFSECTGLTEIHIPDSVTSIGEGAFSWCTGLTKISIPRGLDISNAGLGDDVEIIER